MIDCGSVVVNDVFVDAVFEEAFLVASAQLAWVGFVLGEKELRIAVAKQAIFAELEMTRNDRADARV